MPPASTSVARPAVAVEYVLEAVTRRQSQQQQHQKVEAEQSERFEPGHFHDDDTSAGDGAGARGESTLR